MPDTQPTTKMLVYTKLWNKFKLDGDFMTFVFEVPDALLEPEDEEELELFLNYKIRHLVPDHMPLERIDILNIYPY